MRYAIFERRCVDVYMAHRRQKLKVLFFGEEVSMTRPTIRSTRSDGESTGFQLCIKRKTVCYNWHVESTIVDGGFQRWWIGGDSSDHFVAKTQRCGQFLAPGGTAILESSSTTWDRYR